MITTRQVLPVAAALALVLESCGGSSDGDAADAADVETSATVAATIADDAEDFTEADGTEPEPEAEVVVDTEPEAPAETEPADSVPAETAEVEAEPTDTAEEPVVGDAATGEIAVSLVEWAVEAPAEYAAGDITFTATNGGRFPHEFVVIEGQGYESLPRTESGAVIEDDLPTGALLGRTDRIGGGASESLTVTLAPGNYVLLCNLGSGDNSHAGLGQRLDITVT